MNLNFDIHKITLRKCKMNSAVVEAVQFLSKTYMKHKNYVIFSFYGTIKDLKVSINSFGRFQWST